MDSLLFMQNWYVNIPRQLSNHTLLFLFRYFAIYVDILFGALRGT